MNVRLKAELGLAALLLVVMAPSLRAQHFELGAAFNGFVGYPTSFRTAGMSCGPQAVGLTGSAAWSPIGLGSLEFGATMTGGAGDRSCPVPLFAPTPPDQPFTQLRYPPALEGASLFATHISLVLEPWADRALSPRAKVGAGLIWDKELGNWLYGAGIRYRFGRHSLITELEAWNLTVERFVDTVIFRSATGQFETLGSETATEDERPVVVTVGWSVRVR